MHKFGKGRIMDYPAVASLNVALGNEAACALRQQQTCYTRVGDSMLRVMREAARENRGSASASAWPALVSATAWP